MGGPNGIDLHSHSTASDGQFAPAEVAALEAAVAAAYAPYGYDWPRLQIELGEVLH